MLPCTRSFAAFVALLLASALAAIPSIAVESGASTTATDRADRVVAQVGQWLEERVPGLSPELKIAATELFLDGIKSRSPAELESVKGAADLDTTKYGSALLKALAVAAGKTEAAKQRESWSKMRLSLLWRQREGVEPSSEDVDKAIQKMRSTSDVYFRRLVEGKVEDDDLWALVRRGRETRAASTPTAPRQVTASEILGDYIRQVQEGSALSRVRSYVIEYQLTTAKGAAQTLVLTRMRPDYFRLQVYDGENLSLIISGGAGSFWRWVKGGAPTTIAEKDIPSRDFLGRFIDPLIELDPASLKREPDRTENGKTLRGISSGSGEDRATFWIDSESGELVRRENGNGSKVTYSDSRMVSGVRICHREETVAPDGRTGVLVVKNVAFNTGVFTSFFSPPAGRPLDVFSLQRQWSAALAEAQNR